MDSRSKFTQANAEGILVQIAEHGMSLSLAAKRVGVNPSTVKHWMEENDVFNELVQEALDIRCDNIESALYKRCMEGNVNAIKYALNNLRKDKWRERVDHTVKSDDGAEHVVVIDGVGELPEAATGGTSRALRAVDVEVEEEEAV